MYGHAVRAYGHTNIHACGDGYPNTYGHANTHACGNTCTHAHRYAKP